MGLRSDCAGRGCSAVKQLVVHYVGTNATDEVKALVDQLAAANYDDAAFAAAFVDHASFVSLLQLIHNVAESAAFFWYL